MDKKSLSVLVLEDDVDLQELIQSCLRPPRWNVVVTHDGQKAVTLAETTLPDVIICDASLPEYSGPQVIQALKEHIPTARIPVVLMTGYADADMFSHVPWDGFLAKPFSPQELKQAIESALRLGTKKAA